MQSFQRVSCRSSMSLLVKSVTQTARCVEVDLCFYVKKIDKPSGLT